MLRRKDGECLLKRIPVELILFVFTCSDSDPLSMWIEKKTDSRSVSLIGMQKQTDEITRIKST